MAQEFPGNVSLTQRLHQEAGKPQASLVNGTLILDQIAAPYGVGTDPTGSVVRNGIFVAAGDDCSGSEFYAGEEFGGWLMAEPRTRRASVMRLWSSDRAHAHDVDGHSAVLSGTMMQTLVTEPHQSYRLTYQSHCHQPAPHDSAAGSVGDVRIDDMVVQTFVTPSGTDAVAHETYFTARSTRTLLSFSTVGRVPFALRNVTAQKIALAHLSESDMFEAMLGA